MERVVAGGHRGKLAPFGRLASPEAENWLELADFLVVLSLMPEFCPSHELCRSFLIAQNGQCQKVLPPDWPEVLGSEISERLIEAIADVSYRDQCRLPVDAPPIKLAMVRFEDGRCAWIESRLHAVLNHDMGVPADSPLLPLLLSEFHAHIMSDSEEVRGNFGLVEGSPDEIGVAISPHIPLGPFF